MANPPPRVKRCRPLRRERDDVLLFVTTRTIEERFWLHPLISCAARPCNRKARKHLARFERRAVPRYEKLARRANARSGPYARKFTGAEVMRIAKGLVGSALARAQERRGVEIYAFVALSNHVHLVIRTPQRNASKFMADFKAVTARTINRLTGRSGPLFARRPDIQPILDDPAATDRVAYCVDNPRKANLVSDPETWPGLNLCFGLGDTDELPFEYFDTTAWNAAGRPDDINDFFKVATLKLSPLPQCAGRGRDDYAVDVRRWVKQRVREQQAEQRKDSDSGKHATGAKSPLGLDGILDAAFDQRPKSTKRSRRPYCFGSPELRRQHYEDTSALHDVYAQRSEDFRNGQRDITFPPGTYPPPLIQAA